MGRKPMLKRRAMVAVVALALLTGACGADSSGDSGELRGSIFIDESGSRLCGSMLESYPPQCGDEIVRLGDLQPDAVVALQSPSEPTLAAVAWTDYAAGVTGDINDGVMTNVTIVDPTESSTADGMRARVSVRTITVGQPLVFPIDLRNISDAPITLTFATGQRAEVTLTDDAGVEVYRWSSEIAFTQDVTESELSAGEIFGATLSDNPADLAVGSYTAKAWITAPEAMNVVIEWTAEVTE